MTRPTSTRAQLRRAVAMRLMMPFARRIPAGYATVISTSAEKNTITDTANLNQSRDFWAGHWAYHIESGEVRLILSSHSSVIITPSLRLEYPISTLAANGTYEIHTVFNALEIHEAINQAITSSWPSFFDTMEDTSTVICEDKLEYSLTSITPAVGVVHEVALERPSTRVYATVSSCAGTPIATVTFQEANASADAAVGWKLSFYDGTGRGQSATVLSATANTVTIAAPTTAPVNGTKAMLWDPDEQQLDWYRMKHIHFDTKEWPSQLRLYAPIYAWRGSRLRIKHSTIPISLSTEAATTSIPQEFIIPKACSILCGTRVGDNRVDRQRYAALSEEFNKEAENFKKVNFFRLPDVEIWIEGRDLPDQYIQDPQGDPLNWR